MAASVASAARFAIMYPDPKEDLFGLTTSHDMDGIKSQDFCQRAFDKLRSHFGVTEHEYLQDWDPAHNPRRQDVTPGAKNSKWVVASKSRRFLALELTRAESNALHKSTEAYYKYIKDNDASVLMRLVGHHVADGVHFCVYLNPVANLPATFSQYDIQAGGRRLAPAAARGRPHVHLLEHIAQDAAFLAKQGWSDFNLEVTVATFDKEASLQAVEAWKQEVESKKWAGVGAVISPLQDEVYFVALTGLFGAGSSDPMKYCQALYNFAKKRIFSSPDPNIADVEWEKYYVAQVQKQAMKAAAEK